MSNKWCALCDEVLCKTRFAFLEQTLAKMTAATLYFALPRQQI